MGPDDPREVVGFSSSASTARWNPGSTRPGDSTSSSPSREHCGRARRSASRRAPRRVLPSRRPSDRARSLAGPVMSDSIRRAISAGSLSLAANASPTPARRRSSAATNWSEDIGPASTGSPWLSASMTVLLPPWQTTASQAARTATCGRLGATCQCSGIGPSRAGSAIARADDRVDVEPAQAGEDPGQHVLARGQEGAEADVDRRRVRAAPGERLEQRVVGALLAHDGSDEDHAGARGVRRELVRVGDHASAAASRPRRPRPPARQPGSGPSTRRCRRR